jgi:signal peptidase I
LLGRLADQSPLVVFIVAFLATNVTVQYWRGVRAGVDAGEALARASRREIGTRTLVGVALAAGLALALRTWVVGTYRVEGPSMLPTLQLSDRVIVNKLAYWGGRLPKRGDIVVLRPGALGDAGDDRMLVKRVIGLPGDHVASHDDRPIINGWPVPICDGGPYADIAGPRVVTGRIGVEFLDGTGYLTTWTPLSQPSPEFIVPPGQVYVLGDYRAASKDSRTGNGGKGVGVPLDKIEGRVSRVLFGGQRDGRLELSRLLLPLDLHLHEPGVDTRRTEERIGGCVAARPAESSPPSASAR